MNNSWNDNLFKFFHRRVNDERNFSGDWSTPPDDVFDGAMQEVALLQRRRRRKLLVPILLSLGGILFIAIGLGIYQQIDTINTKVGNLEEVVQDLQTDRYTPEGSEERESTAVQHRIDSHIQALVESTPTRARAKGRFATLTSPVFASVPSEGANQGQLVQGQTAESFKTRSVEVPLELAINPVNGHELPGILHVIKRPLQSLTIPVRDLGMSHSLPESIKQKRLASRISMALAFGQNFSSFSMSKGGAGAPSLTEYDHYYSGGGVESALEYHVSDRWSVVLAGGYDRLNNRSVLTDQMAFNPDQKMTDAAGNSIYQTELTLETPLGSFKRAAEVPMNEVEMKDGDKIQNLTKIDQHLDVANVSLTVRYYFDNDGKWNVYGGAGLDQDLISKSTSNMKSAISMKDHLMKDLTMNTADLDYLAKNFSSLHLETGVKYRIGNRVNVLVNAKFRRSITSLRDVGQDLGPKTYLYQIKTAAGLEYRF